MQRYYSYLYNELQFFKTFLTAASLIMKVHDLMHRWWTKKESSATIEELKKALDFINMAYIHEEYFDNMRKNLISYTGELLILTVASNFLSTFGVIVQQSLPNVCIIMFLFLIVLSIFWKASFNK